MDNINFTESEIQKLFGNEAAEDEDPQRLREYYFKSSVFSRVVTDLPLRILVGHKGIGKSALFKVAIAEEKEKGLLPILIQPNDITDLAQDTTNFLLAVRNWSDGLREIITEKLFDYLGISIRHVTGIREFRGSIVNFVKFTFEKAKSDDTDPAKLDVLIEFVSSPTPVSVYIDDLDRGWQGKKDDVTRISALINAVRDLSNSDRSIHFRIALRSDVYYLYRTSDESTDKIEGSVIWHTWTNHEIFALWVKRIETFFGRPANESTLTQLKPRELARYLRPIMEERFTGSGHWENAPTYRVIMSLIRKRPRDLVKLCTLAARQAHAQHSTKIQTQNLKAVFEEYSQGRIQDTVNEYRSELPTIEALLMNMKPNKRERTAREGYVYTTDGLLVKIRNIMEQRSFVFADGKQADPKTLAAFMYKINFLTARKETDSGVVIRKYFEENRYLSSSFVDFGFDWEIHPAYRWVLQPSSPEDIFNSMELTADSE